MGLLKRENVQICESAADWKDAIRISVQPLEKGGYVKNCYKDGIIENIEKLGPYIMIADNIALPHARPEQGAIETQIGITLFDKPVIFDEKEKSAKLFITLAAKDNESHLETLMKISEILSDEVQVENILKAANEEMLYSYFDNI